MVRTTGRQEPEAPAFPQFFGGLVIDVQRVLALSRQPRHSGGETSPDRAQLLLALGGLDCESSPLARPIAWSEAACRSTERRTGAGEAPRALCVMCPLDEDCRVALTAGAPAEVQRWRERVDRGRALAA